MNPDLNLDPGRGSSLANHVWAHTRLGTGQIIHDLFVSLLLLDFKIYDILFVSLTFTKSKDLCCQYLVGK